MSELEWIKVYAKTFQKLAKWSEQNNTDIEDILEILVDENLDIDEEWIE